MAGQLRKGSPRVKGGRKKPALSAAPKKAREEEKAMEDVLRMLAGSPRLPAPFLCIAKGMLLLDCPSPSAINPAPAARLENNMHQERSDSQDGEGAAGQKGLGPPDRKHQGGKEQDRLLVRKFLRAAVAVAAGKKQNRHIIAPEKKIDRDIGGGMMPEQEYENHEAACALEVEREELRDWAMKLRRGGAMQKAIEALEALRSKCMKATPALSRLVLAHFRSAGNPSKVCKSLGMVTSSLIGKLELIADSVDKAESQANASDNENDCRSINTMGFAQGRQEDGVDSDEETVSGDASTAGSGPGTRSGRKNKQGHSESICMNKSTRAVLDDAGAKLSPSRPQDQGLNEGFPATTVDAQRYRSPATLGSAVNEAKRCNKKSSNKNHTRKQPQQEPQRGESRRETTSGGEGNAGEAANMRNPTGAPLPSRSPVCSSYVGSLPSPRRATPSKTKSSAATAASRGRMPAQPSMNRVDSGNGDDEKYGECRAADSFGKKSGLLGALENMCEKARKLRSRSADASAAPRRFCNDASGGGAWSKRAAAVTPSWWGRDRTIRPQMDFLDEESFPAQGKDTAKEAKVVIQDVQGILRDMENTPLAYRDLELENELFGVIKQLLAWKPPPKWQRNRRRFNAQLVAGAGILLKKAIIQDGPVTGFWPVLVEGDRVQKRKVGKGGLNVAFFRRKKTVSKEAGGALSTARIRGMWYFPASVCRYASKPPVSPPSSPNQL